MKVIPTYQDRRPEFEKVKTRIESILLDHPDGLFAEQVLLLYIERYKHVAKIGNRLREMRADGLVLSFPGKRKTWRLNPEKYTFPTKKSALQG